MFACFRSFAKKKFASLLLVATACLAGCGTGELAGPSASAGFKITGNVHGGAWPVQGATIRLMETQSNGVWNTTTQSYKGTAKQLLRTTSDQSGSFSFPDTGWTCDAGQYAYITVTGGHTASSNNNNVVQVAVIGGCSADLATQTEIDNVNLFISELSTVAAAYALGDFISIDNTNAATGKQIVNITAPANNNSSTPGCVSGSGGMTCVHAGLRNAFQNAYNLVDQVTYGANQFPSGAARTVLPGNSQGTVPQAVINTLGNILQSCVDSAGGSVANYASYVPGGSGSSRCGDLFYWCTAPGATSAPTNTLETALNMARYPTNNVDALFKLQPRAVFFTPTLSSDVVSGTGSQYMAFTISIVYTGTGLTNDAGFPKPVDVALDENDNAYVLYRGGSSSNPYGAVDELQPNGTGVFAGAHQSTLSNPASIALDSNGNVWVTNDAWQNGNLFQINSPGSGGVYGAIGQTITVPYGYAAGVAVDMSNNVWVGRDASDLGQSLFRFNAKRSYASTSFLFSPTLYAPTKRLTVDANQNVLGVTSSTDGNGNTVGFGNASVYLFPYGSNSFPVLSTTSLTAGNGYALVMSYADVLFAPLNQQLGTETGLANGQLTANGAGVFSAFSTTGAGYTNPMGAAMDGAGTLFWPDFSATGQVFRFVPSTAGSASSGTLTSFGPCVPVGTVCTAGLPYLRGMAIDSSGSLWYLADNTTGAVVQTLGFAAPTYPLQSFAHAGVVIQ